MPDFHSTEDEATRYLLGELTPAESREFETRMAQSTELRALVRELEEGAVALSTALPQRRPPSEVWLGIEKAISREESQSAFAWWKSFWRNGWAVAALCLMGWLLSAILMNRHGETAKSEPPHEIVAAPVSPTPEHIVAVAPLPTNAERKIIQASTTEIYDLRVKIAQMEHETNLLSLLLDQTRARLGETNRFKFYHLTADATAAHDSNSAQLSPALQRAVLLSIGRELGWMPVLGKSHTQNGHAVTTIDGVDFVDLRPQNGNTGNPPPTPPANDRLSQPTGQQQMETQMADLSDPAIPAFVSGDKLVVGLDSSVVPPNSSVTLSVASLGTTGANYGTGGWAVTSWNFTTGENPTMVTVPFSVNASSDSGGLTFFINSVTPSGISNTAQFFAPSSP